MQTQLSLWLDGRLHFDFQKRKDDAKNKRFRHSRHLPSAVEGTSTADKNSEVYLEQAKEAHQSQWHPTA